MVAVVTGIPFVVLHHTGYGKPHFDLMLAMDDTGPLRTWRCSSWPIDAATKIEPLPDHRRAYLIYEGEISGGRGQVRRVCSGTAFVRVETNETLSLDVLGQPITLPVVPIRRESP